MAQNRSRGWIASGVLLLGGAGLLAAPGSFAEGSDELWLEGRVVPFESTPVLVPENRLSIAGFRVVSKTVLLEDLAEEGKPIRAGGHLASFAVPEAALRDAVGQKVQLVALEAEREQLRLRTGLQGLEARLALAKQAEKKAALETKKKGVLSRRDSDLVELAAREAAFEVRALGMRVLAQKGILEASQAYFEERIRQSRQLEADLEETLARFRPVAPHAGRIWYAILQAKGRKARKQDRLTSGQVFMWLARDDRVAVEFLVPESRLAEMQAGKTLRFMRLPAGATIQGRVVTTGRLPVDAGQEGEKHFLVRAEFIGPADRFVPGMAVRVEP